MWEQLSKQFYVSHNGKSGASRILCAYGVWLKRKFLTKLMALTFDVPISRIGWWNTFWGPESVVALGSLCQKVKTQARGDGQEPPLGSGCHVEGRTGQRPGLSSLRTVMILWQCLHSGLRQPFPSVWVSTLSPQLTFLFSASSSSNYFHLHRRVFK